MGISSIEFFDFPDNKMDDIPLLDIIRVIEKIVVSFQPEVILTHHFCDLNIDHSLVSRAVITASRPQPNSSVKEILFFETSSVVQGKEKN